jgi:hypothetical protein
MAKDISAEQEKKYNQMLTKEVKQIIARARIAQEYIITGGLSVRSSKWYTDRVKNLEKAHCRCLKYYIRKG